MTSTTVSERELSRLRKFKQLSMAYKEPCFQFWLATNSFYSYTCFPIFFGNSELEARVHETDQILAWQSQLNVPFVNKTKQMKSGQISYKSRRSWRLLQRYRTKTYTGKIGGLNDDLAICLQLAITGLRCFYQSEKYNNFRPEM